MRRIRIDFIFTAEAEADTIWRQISSIYQKAGLRNIGFEKSHIVYEECGHDSGKPCVTIARLEK